MSSARAEEVLKQILADFKELNTGPNQNVPVKTVWTRAMSNGVTHGQDLQDALQLGVDKKWLTFTSGGVGGMGTVTMTDDGYAESRK